MDFFFTKVQNIEQQLQTEKCSTKSQQVKNMFQNIFHFYFMQRELLITNS